MRTRQLKPGMKLDHPVVDRLGRNLVARGAELDEYMIDSMVQMGVMSVYIQDGEEEEEEMVGRRRVINSDSDVDEAELDGDDYAASVPSVRSVRSARTSRSARAGSTSRDVYARPYKTKRRESRNDEVREDGRCDG